MVRHLKYWPYLINCQLPKMIQNYLEYPEFFANIYWTSDFMKVVRHTFVLLYIEIAHSNFTFCGAYTLSFLVIDLYRRLCL